MFYFCSPIQSNEVMDFSIKVKDYSEVYVGGVAELLPRLLPDKRVIVISDTNIDRYYHSMLEPFDHILIGLGESSKTLLTVDTIYRRLIELGADRSTFILGVGGGIVTDIAGFVAATYMRGIEFGFVSTTLLGQVDASVGGKNGENVKFTVADEQTVTVTFVAETGAISVVMSGGEENPELGDYGIAALVVAMMAATAGAVVLTKKKEF